MWNWRDFIQKAQEFVRVQKKILDKQETPNPSITVVLQPYLFLNGSFLLTPVHYFRAQAKHSQVKIHWTLKTEDEID